MEIVIYRWTMTNMISTKLKIEYNVILIKIKMNKGKNKNVLLTKYDIDEIEWKSSKCLIDIAY